MAYRSPERGGALLTGALLTVPFLMAGCGGDDHPKAETVFTVPSSPTPSAAVETAPGTQPGIEGARAALRAFLRGQAAGDPAVCRYVAEGGAFVKGPALRGDCPQGVRNTPHLVRPMERQALRTVEVGGGRIVGEEALIPFSSLRWTSGSMTVSTLQAEYTLQRENGNWQIVR
ncbi:hypothetical protein [Actinomadura roseirufa]|uniref:hypothetical protein n=1 Tax=Actinomadura roseirufa TaxID=2094049 RepID=UPI0013F14D30|nr:hypothetical protein [Actinomadura roseirufa]